MNQKMLNELINNLWRFVPGDQDLEMEHLYAGDIESVKVDGWYANRYREDYGESYPLFDDMRCIITDEQIEMYGLDIDQAFNNAECYVVE